MHHRYASENTPKTHRHVHGHYAPTNAPSLHHEHLDKELRSGPVGTATTLLYLYRNEADAAFLPELRAIAASDPRLSLQGVATGETLPDLERLLPDARRLSGTECYLCGPPGLIASLKSALRARGVAARNIHYENFEFR